jgi:hypothetical protein
MAIVIPVGIKSITFLSNDVRDLPAEIFHFTRKGGVAKADAHYTQNL